MRARHAPQMAATVTRSVSRIHFVERAIPTARRVDRMSPDATPGDTAPHLVIVLNAITSYRVREASGKPIRTTRSDAD